MFKFCGLVRNSDYERGDKILSVIATKNLDGADYGHHLSIYLSVFLIYFSSILHFRVFEDSKPSNFSSRALITAPELSSYSLYETIELQLIRCTCASSDDHRSETISYS